MELLVTVTTNVLIYVWNVEIILSASSMLHRLHSYKL